MKYHVRFCLKINLQNKFSIEAFFLSFVYSFLFLFLSIFLSIHLFNRFLFLSYFLSFLLTSFPFFLCFYFLSFLSLFLLPFLSFTFFLSFFLSFFQSDLNFIFLFNVYPVVFLPFPYIHKHTRRPINVERHKPNYARKIHGHTREGSFDGIVANVRDCDIAVSSFKFQFHYYVHFRTNAQGNGMNLLIPQLWFK